MPSPVWDKNRPQSSEFGSNFPLENQQNMQFLETALSLEHTFPGVVGPPQTAGQHQAASETQAGFVRIATAAEVAAGVSDIIAVSPLGLQTGISGSGQTRYGRLKVHNNSGTPASKIDIVADSVILTDGGSPAVPFKVTNVSVTIDGTVTGANGLDTGTLAAHFYYLYVIYNPTTATTAGLASLSATAPTLPSGYTYYRLVSVAYYDATATSFRKFHQYNRMVYLDGGSYTGGDGNTYYSAGVKMFTVSTNTGASHDCSAYIPPDAVTIGFQARITNYDVSDLSFFLAWDSSIQVNVLPIFQRTTTDHMDLITGTMTGTYQLNPSAPQTIYSRGMINSNCGDMWLMSFELDI